jgi:flagellar hook-associated protein 1 FlgK
MSDLMSLLSLGSAGITAQGTGIAVATNNVANVNTAGYSRQRVDLQSLIGAPLVGGVRSGSPDRLQDYLLAGRIRTAGGSLSMSRAFAAAVLDVESRLASSGPTVHQQLGALSSRMASLTSSPTDRITRDSVVSTARDLIAGIRRRAAELDQAKAEANARIRDNAAQATSLAKRLAETNIAIARSGDPAMRDQRDQIANQLAEITGGTARIDGDGHMRFVLDGGAVLVDGGTPAALQASPDATTGNMKLEVVAGAMRRDVTSDIGGGKLGADLAVRDGTISRATGELDQLAFDVATAYNTAHAANAGLDGVSGRAMFVAPTQVSGAARSIALDPALDADSNLLAAGAPGAGPGDNRGALALLAVSSAPVAAGGKSLSNAALDVLSNVGVAASEANADVSRDQLVSDHLASLRDSLAGVDIQEELSNLARFEHATSAMTRFVSTVDSLLGDLIDRL